MSADPLLGGPMLGLHDLVDEPPALTTHTAPALTTHDLPSLGNALVETAPVYDPDADFWAGGDLFEGGEDELGRRIEQTLYEANQQTGQDEVLAKYGFTGAGQTVAVIDTGIAYTHYALGGGYGTGYRVVGGWDFTENDANFYDDQGPKAAHGTHVAGIIGARGDGIHSGVATGVDLVGLRVFDDAGNGYFHWVEQALRWVHTNRNSYANPITAINLSLGTEWNSDSNPSWAMLEDEFAQLEADGIFISVSAGNSFTNYNSRGLSYPASSDHVVPVMATDPNGQLSFFSQRATYAIAAPGRYITSTVPDYAANDADTIDDDWLSMSGTSMAAPYVAGASTLVRQAMQFVGQTGIDQWDIYNHLMATADTFYDSATATNYKRLNLAAAIDALMPADDFGSSQIDAYNLGTLTDSGSTPLSTLSGVISTLDDADCFKFVAGSSGTVTVSLPQFTHELAPQWNVWGASSWTVNGAGECVFDVVAGQTYTFSLATSDGLGYYDLSVNLEASFSAIEWGAITPQETRTGLSVSGEQWYQVTAGRAGFFTAEALPQSGFATVAIYDAQMNALTAAGSRADYQAQAGQMLYLRVMGSSSNFNLRMTNALSVSGAAATLVGTASNDAIVFTAGSTSRLVSLNGVSYTVAVASASTFNVSGGGGADSFRFNGSSADETLRVGADTLQVTSTNLSLAASGLTSTTSYSGGGSDKAWFTDTSATDHFVAKQGFSQIVGGGVTHLAFGFTNVEATSTQGGADYAEAYDSAGNDRFWGKPGASILSGANFTFTMRGFDRVYGYSLAGGIDTAELYDSPTSDVLIARPEFTLLRNSTSLNYAMAFEYVYAYSVFGGPDTAFLYGSAGNDIFIGRKDYSLMRGPGFENQVRGFTTVKANADFNSGDIAFVYGTSGAEFLYATSTQTSIYGSGFTIDVMGFGQVRAYGGGGLDRVEYRSLQSLDRFYGSGNLAQTTQNGRIVSAFDFDDVDAWIAVGQTPTMTLGVLDYAFEQLGA